MKGFLTQKKKKKKSFLNSKYILELNKKWLGMKGLDAFRPVFQTDGRKDRVHCSFLDRPMTSIVVYHSDVL
jgi:hypothetical protein